MTAQEELDWGPDWEPGWEGHLRQQRKETLRSTPAQRLEWLEGALAFAYKVGALKDRRGELSEPADGRSPVTDQD